MAKKYKPTVASWSKEEASKDIDEKIDNLNQSAMYCMEDYPKKLSEAESTIKFLELTYPQYFTNRDKIEQIRKKNKEFVDKIVKLDDIGREFRRATDNFEKNCKISKREE